MSSFIKKLIRIRDSKGAAIGIASTFVLVSLLISVIIHISQKTFLVRATHVIAENFEKNILKETYSITNAIKRTGLRWQQIPSAVDDVWRADALEFIKDTKGVDVFMRVDTNGVLQWAEGIEVDHTPEKGFDLSLHGNLKEKMKLAKDNKRPEFTEVTKIDKDHYAIHIFYPVWKASDFDGFIGVRINIDELLFGILGDPQNRGFILHAFANGKHVFKDAAEVDLTDHKEAFGLNLDDDNEGWDFFVYPSKEVLALFKSPLPFITALSGFLIALLFYFTMTSRIRSKTNAKLFVKEVNQRKKIELKLQHMAQHDALTHLPNRSYLNIYLENKIKESDMRGDKIAVLYLNIDNFKQINDIHDHQLADEVLKIIPGRINNALKKNAMTAHMGGDEFVICISENLIEQKLFIYAEDLLKSIRKPIAVRGENIRITASIGVCYFPQHGHLVSELISKAEHAMNQAKNLGKDIYTIFDERLESISVEKAEMVQAFNKGLDNNEFEMFFQPRHDIKSGAMVGSEALLRWRKDGKLLAPDTFLNVAEESGMIVNICNKAFDLAFAQYHQLFGGNPPIMLAINVSAKQLAHPDFLNDLFGMMEAHQFPSEMLEVELTEQTLIQNYDSSLATLNALSSAGVKIALDDFGTGYSSLSYLKNFPVNVLKIDKSFIKDIHKDAGDLELVKAIIAMGNSLNMEVVAEGVENQSQLNILEQEHCKQAQGYFLNKPLSFEKFHDLFNKKSNRQDVSM